MTEDYGGDLAAASYSCNTELLDGCHFISKSNHWPPWLL